MEYLTFSGKVERFNEGDGDEPATFKALVVPFNKDVGKDVLPIAHRIRRGAFARTIREDVNKGRTKLYRDHNRERVIGLVTSAEEQERGLVIEGELAPTDLGRESRTLLKPLPGSGWPVLSEWSIGFDKLAEKLVKDDSGRELYIEIEQARLFEVSLVPHGLAPGTRTISAAAQAPVMAWSLPMPAGGLKGLPLDVAVRLADLIVFAEGLEVRRLLGR